MSWSSSLWVWCDRVRRVLAACEGLLAAGTCCCYDRSCSCGCSTHGSLSIGYCNCNASERAKRTADAREIGAKLRAFQTKSGCWGATWRVRRAEQPAAFPTAVLPRSCPLCHCYVSITTRFSPFSSPLNAPTCPACRPTSICSRQHTRRSGTCSV